MSTHDEVTARVREKFISSFTVYAAGAEEFARWISQIEAKALRAASHDIEMQIGSKVMSAEDTTDVEFPEWLCERAKALDGQTCDRMTEDEESTSGSIVINPGTGPVAGATAAEAGHNMSVFAQEVAQMRDEPRENFTVEVLDLAEDNGRFFFSLTHLPSESSVEIEMPGLPLDQVRYLDLPTQDIWDFPRLYVDGSSWVWLYAVGAVAFEGDK